MSDDTDEALEERIESIQRRAENFREFLKDGEEVTISFMDGEVAVEESYRSKLERKHPKLYGRLMSMEAQLETGWLPYYIGLLLVIAVIIGLHLPATEALLGPDLVGLFKGWWFFLLLPASLVYMASLGCGVWRKRIYRRHRLELLELIANAHLDRDTMLVMLRDVEDLETVILELKLDPGPF